MRKLQAIALIGSAVLLMAQANVRQVPLNAPTINQSVTIATGNTFQQILPIVTPSTSNDIQRRSLTIQNNNTTDSCWISFGTISGVAISAANATKATSILLTAGGSFQRYAPYVPSDAIIGTCASNADTLYIDTQ